MIIWRNINLHMIVVSIQSTLFVNDTNVFDTFEAHNYYELLDLETDILYIFINLIGISFEPTTHFKCHIVHIHIPLL